jgi:hypothetical protein
MDFKQSKILLDKINALHKSISIEEENISSIERDLMLSYIRQFYESFLNTTPETLSTPAKKTVKKVKIKKQATPAQEYAPPKKVRIPDSLKDLEASIPPPPPEPQVVIPPPPAPEPEVVLPPPPAPKQAPAPKAAPLGKYKSLFGNKKAAELSEKLSQQPIKDITRAIAINDRLLYVNDLFGKDTNAYSAGLIKLNNFSSMEEAQNTLLEMAQKYDWLDEEKEDTAQAFVKLVRRRYI